MKMFCVQILLISSVGFATTTTVISTESSGSGLNSWSACIDAESAAQATAALQCKGKVADCEFTENSRRVGDDNFTCSAVCNTTCALDSNSTQN